MKEYKIFAKFPCVICLLEKEIELEENKFLEISLKGNELVKVFPVCKRNDCYSLAYSQRVEDFDILDFKDFYLLEIKEKLISKNPIQLLVNEFDKCLFSLYDFPHILSVNYDGKCYTYNFQEKFEEYTLKNNYLLAKSEDKMTFCLFNKASKKFDYIIATSIEINKDKIITIDMLNDIAKHCEKREYTFNNDNLKLINKELYYINNEPKLCFNTDIMPIAFLEAVKFGDYNLARKYLTVNLKARLSDNHLKAFFKDIDKIIPIDNKYAVIDQSGQTEIYTFEFEENLINNIVSL